MCNSGGTIGTGGQIEIVDGVAQLLVDRIAGTSGATEVSADELHAGQCLNLAQESTKVVEKCNRRRRWRSVNSDNRQHERSRGNFYTDLFERGGRCWQIRDRYL